MHGLVRSFKWSGSGFFLSGIGLCLASVGLILPVVMDVVTPSRLHGYLDEKAPITALVFGGIFGLVAVILLLCALWQWEEWREKIDSEKPSTDERLYTKEREAGLR